MSEGPPKWFTDPGGSLQVYYALSQRSEPTCMALSVGFDEDIVLQGSGQGYSGEKATVMHYPCVIVAPKHNEGDPTYIWFPYDRWSVFCVEAREDYIMVCLVKDRTDEEGEPEVRGNPGA